MKLVIGGAYQGKLDYAKRTYGLEKGWADGRTCGAEEPGACRGIHHFHIYVRRFLKDGTLFLPDFSAGEGVVNRPVSAKEEEDGLTELERQAERFAEGLFLRNPELILVTDEIGYGIVPMDREDRLWREADGRVCTCLAARADEVVRVICGIGLRLK